MALNCSQLSRDRVGVVILMNNKPRKQRVEEQKIIYDYVDMLERYSNVAETESVGKSLCLTRHDGYTYSTIVVSGAKLTIRFEVEFPGGSRD